MKTILVACLALMGGAVLPAPSYVLTAQDDDLGKLTDDELLKRYKEAVIKGDKDAKKAVADELEKRDLHVFDVPSGGSSDDKRPRETPKESLKTTHFDLKGPSQKILKAKGADLEELAGKFRELFEKAPQRGTIVFYEDKEAKPAERDSGKMKIQVFAKSNEVKQRKHGWELRWGLVGDAFKDSGPAHPDLALTHEVMHLMFIAYIKQEFPEAKHEARGEAAQTHYGTPLPDWLDEGLACTGEAEALRKLRREQLAEQPRLKLEALLEMSHPTMDGAGDVVAFYAQSYALVDFLVAKAGPKFFRQMVAGLAKGKLLKEILADEKARPAKLPATVAGLETALIEYVESEEFLNGSR